MAEDTSEKLAQGDQAAGETPPVPTMEEPKQTSDGKTPNEKAQEKSADEKAAMKASDESSQGEDPVDLKKLDSTPPRSNEEKGSNDPYRSLPSHEAAILRRQVETPDVKVGLATLYRYASAVDLTLLCVGSLCAIAAGAILPVMTIIFGSLQGTFANYFNGTASYDDFMGSMTHLVLYFVYLGIGEFFAQYLATVTFIYTGEHISGKVREHYLESCLKQNIVSPLRSFSAGSIVGNSYEDQVC